MYTPDHFNEDRLDILHAVIENNNFGLLIAQVDGELVASHLPFLLDPARDPMAPCWSIWRAQIRNGRRSMESWQRLRYFPGPTPTFRQIGTNRANIMSRPGTISPSIVPARRS